MDWRVLKFDTLPSTNSRALELLRHGDTHLIVMTDEQTSGEGRQGRGWHFNRGSSLAFSIAFIPQLLEMERLPQITLVCAVSVASALIENFGISGVQVKWPNDIYVNGKKVCGILAESAEFDGRYGVVIGVGLNINQLVSDFPPQLEAVATSLAMETGNTYDTIAVFDKIIEQFDIWQERWLVSFKSVQEYLSKVDYMKGREVRYDGESAVIAGVSEGIDDCGAIVIREFSGQISRITAGEVNLYKRSR